jgi:hypothetical protein
VTTVFEAELRYIEVALRWCGDMYHVRPGFTQEFCQITEVLLDGKSFIKLPRHQWLSVADSDDFASFDSSDLRSV